MATLETVDGLSLTPDRLVPRFEVYFAREPDGPPPAASPEIVEESAALAREAARLDGRIYRADPSASPRLGSLFPLAGPFGELPGQRTNDVVSVTFTESLDALSSVSVELLNVYDPRAKRYRYTDAPPGQAGPLLDFGDTLALRLGYGAGVAWVFDGVITTLDVSFPADGESHLSITAVDRRERLRNQKPEEPRVFSDMTEEQIAAEVASSRGLYVATRSGQATDSGGDVQEPPDQDELQFLTDRASQSALELGCFGNALFVRRPGDVTTKAIRYVYRTGLTSFQPSLSTAGKPTRVRVKAQSPDRGEEIAAESDPARLRDIGLAPRTGPTVLERVARFGERTEVITDRHVTSQEEAQRVADGVMKRNVDDALTVSGDLIGDPNVRVGATLQIDGVGRFSGAYYITQTTHRFGVGGYQTSFRARRASAPGEESA